MTNTETLARVRRQQELSDAVYEAIDSPLENGTPRHRVILQDCLGVLATTLERSEDYGYAGNQAHRRLLDHLANGGLYTSNRVYEPYPDYRAYATGVRATKFRPSIAPDTDLAHVFARYADTQRGTRDTTGAQETNSRHVTHVASMAVPYANAEYPDLDSSLITSYALIHDILEWRIGDTVSVNLSAEAYAQKQHDEADELPILIDVFERRYPKLIQLVENYESLADDEARFVKSFEKLDPGYTHFHNQGIALHELGIDTPEKFWQAHHATTRRMSGYALNFPALMADRDARAEMIQAVTWVSRTETKSRAR